MNFPHYIQNESKSCGAVCLYNISQFFELPYSFEYLKRKCEINKKGVSLLKLCETAELIGISSIAVKISFASLTKVKLPIIALLNKSHYIVVYKISKDKIYISDPANGLIVFKRKDFIKQWYINKAEGIAVLLEPANTK